MTALAPDSALAGGLASGRDFFNERIAAARKARLGFDVDALSAWLTGPAAALAERVAATSPSGEGGLSTEVTSAIVDAALMLVGHGLAKGDAREQFAALWTKVLPECASLLSENPRYVFGILHNAALNIRRDKGDVISRWIAYLASLADKVSTVAELRALSSVLAWRSGLAHYRETALQAAATLSPALAKAALGISDGIGLADALSRFAEDRWYDPSSDSRETLQAAHEVGSFVGYGGSFPRPPKVRADGDGFAVESGDRHFWLCADAFGAVLRADSEEGYANADRNPANKTSADVTIRDGELHYGSYAARLSLPQDGLSLASTRDTAAVYSPWSHSIIIIPLRGSVRR